MADRLLNLKSSAALAKNEQFQFARAHALSMYKNNIVYSYIPKNACSSFRYITSRENGLVSSLDEMGRVQNNNSTFTSSLEQLVNAEYTFVILRCPYRRAVSSFLDKSITEPWRFWRLRNDSPLSLGGISNRLSARFRDRNKQKFDAYNEKAFTFLHYLRRLQDVKGLNADHHWRPQVDFFVYREYDDTFCVEKMDVCIRDFQNRTGINYIDTRNHTNHSTSDIEKVHVPNGYDLSVFDLYKMRKAGQVPSFDSMLGGEAVRLIESAYGDDIELYRRFYPDEIFVPR